MQSPDSFDPFHLSVTTLAVPATLPAPGSPRAGQQLQRFSGSGEQLGSSDVLKVSARSRPSAVAGAIAGVMRTHGDADVQSIGAGATNQAVKAIAIARAYLQEEGIDLYCVPTFCSVAIDGEERTALRLHVQRRLG
jgi:stage V sporulation protein S